MNFKKEYQQIILPLFKAAPVIIGLIVIATMITRRAVTYMVPEYRASGAIKINNLSYTQASFGVLGKEEGAVPKQNETFLTEVEVFHTKNLIKKTIENLNWELTVHRVGKLSTVELYDERPIIIEYDQVAEGKKNKFFYIDYLGDDQFRYRIGGEKDTIGVQIALGETYKSEYINFSIHTIDAFLQEKPNSLLAGDRFAFKINTLESLATLCANQKLFVKPVEKDISIVKIFFNHELPEKAQAFVNGLMQTYIDESRFNKLNQADQTLEYLDEQLDTVNHKLKRAESQLAYYRSKNRLLNSTLETDATLKERTQLELQKVSVEMKYSEISRLQSYLLSGNALSDFSPNFESLQDPIFRESYLKGQAYETQRKDLLQKYTVANPKVTNLDEKVKENRTFLNESVISTLNNLAEKEKEVNVSIGKVNSRIKDFPDKERRLISLEREVSLNEAIYNYLMRKRTETAIGKTSDLFPHKILEHAERPKTISSPNKSLLFGLAFLLALMAGMFYAYLRSFYKEQIKEKEELENLPAPVLGVVYKKPKKKKASFSLVSGLVSAVEQLPASPIKGQGQLLVTSSTLPGEGKSFISREMAKAFAAAGKRVLVIDMDIRKPSLHESFGLENNIGYCDILEERIYALRAVQKSPYKGLYVLTAGQLQTDNYALLFSRRSLDFVYDFRWHFDVVIVDTPPVGVFEDALPLMHESSANLFVIRAGYTKRRLLGTISSLLTDTNIPNLHLVLNDVKKKSKVPGYESYMKVYNEQSNKLSYA